MKKRVPFLLLTVAAAAVTSSVQASYVSGDLLVGFTSSGAANDFVFDIGRFSSLYNGETWSLGANAGGTFTSSQFASANWGVIGALASSQTIYSSAGSANIPQENAGDYQTIQTSVKDVGQNSVSGSGLMVGQSTANSWYTQTDQPYGTVGSTLFFNVLQNPNVGTSSLAYLYANDNNGDPAAYLGNFSISADGNTLVYTVPEPSAVSLLASFGLLSFSLRRRLARNS